MMDKFQRIPSYCEICKRVYITNGIGLGQGASNITITNSSVGRCPIDGGRLLIPDGTYSVRDDILEFASHRNETEIKEILSVLSNVKVITSYNKLKLDLQYFSNQEDSNKVMSWIDRFLGSTDSLVLASRLTFYLLGLGSGILAEEIYDNFNTSDDEIRQMQILENQKDDKKRDKLIIDQNKQILANQNKQEKRQQYKERKSTVVSKKKKK